MTVATIHAVQVSSPVKVSEFRKSCLLRRCSLLITLKPARTSLAFISGLLLALGYISAAEPDGWTVMRIMIGLGFGAWVVASMILWPQRITRRLTCFASAPLVAAFIAVHVARMETLPEVIVTVVGGLAFLGIQFAFASLSADRSG